MSKQRKGNSLLETIIAVVVALIISLLLVVVAAFAIKLFNIGDGAICIINQVIKGLSILLACLICLKSPSNGWLRGAIVGMIYIITAFVVFSLLSGEFIFDLSLANDAVLGMVSGLISGIISVNIRKREA